MAKNHSHVLPGGTVAFPVSFGSPGLFWAGRNPPAGVESLLRCICCLIQFMVTSWGVPRLATAGDPRIMQNLIYTYHHTRVDYIVRRTEPFNYLTGSTGFRAKAWGNDGLQESNPLTLKGLVRRATQGGLSCAEATRRTSQRRHTCDRSLL